MARLADIVIDCAHPAALARFWAASLDGYAVAPYDDEELGATVLDDQPVANLVVMHDPEGNEFCVLAP